MTTHLRPVRYLHSLYTPSWLGVQEQRRVVTRYPKQSKAVPLHAMKALVGRRNIAPTHS
jgi:hypothetical protein